MLILTRRVGESLMVGDEITVTVLGVKGNQVRIGVNAPKDVAVHREEIYNRIQDDSDTGAQRGEGPPAWHRMTLNLLWLWYYAALPESWPSG